MIIRNDDVSAETDLEHFKWFCELCDKYNIKIIQCITPLGISSLRRPDYADDEIVAIGGKRAVWDNKPLLDYLLSRTDDIAVHGLWHTHNQSAQDIYASRSILYGLGFNPTWYVAPFNETFQDQDSICGLKVIPTVQRLEDCHYDGTPTDEIVYLHSWRYDGSYYQRKDLEECLKRLQGC